MMYIQVNIAKKRLCESLRQHEMKIISFKKKMKLLTKEQQESYKNAKICYTILKKELKINMRMRKINDSLKLEIIVVIQGNTEVLCIAYVI